MSDRRELRMFGSAARDQALAWDWVEQRLRAAGIYWVIPVSDGYPHPRPVWGVWHEQRLHLSIGTPAVRRRLPDDPRLTVHLESGTEVVVVEGRASRGRTAPEVVAAYDAKYDYVYDVEQFGDLIELRPETVLAWRAVGAAGRDGFGESGKWAFG
jgi:hypothetical protein